MAEAQGKEALTVFVSYAHRDEALRQELLTHLALLQRQGVISVWHDRNIDAGTEWKQAIDSRLETAQIILLLVSADFLASEYCYAIEMQRAMARHEAGAARVIPILLRAVDWSSAPFGKLQAFPQDGQPITSWPNRDEAFAAVTRGLRAVAAGWQAVLPAPRVMPQADEAQRRYYRDCISRWSVPRYALDSRFVQLTLLLDQGDEAQGGRWQPQRETFHDLGAVLQHVPDPALVVLGAPGAGKSTLLRHYELVKAQSALETSPDQALDTAPLTFFVSLHDYQPLRADVGSVAPQDWLAAQWRAACPALPPFDEILHQRPVTLLLDALNEMPQTDAATMQGWQTWLRQLVRQAPGTRVVFSCRSLDYSTTLSSSDLPVPQVRIEPLDNAQVQAFIQAYCPEHAGTLWQNLQGTPQLEVLRSPYYLRLLVSQSTGGAIPTGRAALFTGFVRQALQREIAAGNPLLQPDALLHARDVQRLTEARHWPPYELPERGMLIPHLCTLALQMQNQGGSNESTQVRVSYDTALALLAHPRAEDLLKAGAALGLLDEDRGADQVLYVHQLLQEYCAARHLARVPQPDLVQQTWQAEQVRPTLHDTLSTLADSDPLPPLPGTGWEETTLLAAAMASAPDAFVEALMPHNLPLAGRCAAQPDVQVSEVLQDTVRQALLVRMQDPAADLRARIAAGLALGELDDPRFVRHEGPHGAYLLPPLIEIPGGTYRIGSDEGYYTDEAPVHEVVLAPFALGQFPVTNAEWALFMQAGGYDEERWWGTDEAQAWRSGEATAEGAKQQWREDRQYVQKHPDFFRQLHEQQRATSREVEFWDALLAMSHEEFEAQLTRWYPPGRQTQPRYWNDDTLNNPVQPVVGICWFEARAYCAWLSAQTGAMCRLPTEAEWEAAARGTSGRRYAWGEDFTAARCNTFETHLRRTTPVGIFPGGRTPNGVEEMTGNVWEWTSSLYQDYPYDAADGQEDPEHLAWRVVRGGSWFGGHLLARASYRYHVAPVNRVNALGLRLVLVVPISS